MVYSAAIVGVLTLIAVLVFFWRESGLGSGRRFGNRVAAHMGMSKSLFHTLLVHGVKGSPRELLASFAQSKLDVNQASIAISPTLSKGIERMEARFGPQEMVDEVKPLVARLLAQSQEAPKP